MLSKVKNTFSMKSLNTRVVFKKAKIVKLYKYSLRRKSEIDKNYSLLDYIFLQKRKVYDFSKGSCTNIGELEPYTGIFYIYKVNKLDNTIKNANLKRKNKYKKILSLKEKHFETRSN